MESNSGRLPEWAEDVQEVGKVCKHCGEKISVVTALALLGENGSYFCDPETMKQAHEIQLD